MKTVIESFDSDDSYGINFLRALMELSIFVCSPRDHMSEELSKLLSKSFRDWLLAFRKSMSESDVEAMMELAFNIAYDGAKYCKNYEIFQSGLILVCMVRWIFPKTEDQLANLEDILHELEWDEKAKSNNAVRYISLWMQMRYGPTDHGEELCKLNYAESRHGEELSETEQGLLAELLEAESHHHWEKLCELEDKMTAEEICCYLR